MPRLTGVKLTLLPSAAKAKPYIPKSLREIYDMIEIKITGIIVEKYPNAIPKINGAADPICEDSARFTILSFSLL